ncbi:MAG: M48 family metallopeptidase, partial [Clostridia bacterium]|nr:M48 family metallopeptidase [Clostridia bacterium]
ATGLRASGFSVRRMSSRWGSCTVGSGRIRLSLSLSREPDRLLSYVILHELAHLRYPDHGAGFRAFLTGFLPDWEERRRELRHRSD